MLSILLSTLGVLGGFLFVVVMLGLVVVVLFQSIEDNRPEIALALLAVALLAYYVGYRVGGV